MKESPAQEALKSPETYAKALDTGLTVRQQAADYAGSRQHYTDSRAAGNSRVRSVVTGARNTLRDTVQGGQNPKDLNRAGMLGKANNLLKVGMGVNDLVGDKGRKAVDALTGGLVNGTPQERNQALGDLGDGVKTLAETAKAGLETARDVQKYGSAYRAANNSIKASGVDLANQARRGMARDIAKQVFNKVDPGDAASAQAAGNRYSALHAANRGTAIDRTAAAHGISNNDARDILKAGRNKGLKVADDALKQGIEAGAKSAAGTLAKTAGRFAPGANVAIAVADTAKAISTLNSDANAGKKITAGITALGSIAAATNIPVVSQAGAAVSAVSDFVGSFF
ncbi:hypothetical protein ACLESD_14135 [Pyxidicoccus sp. 3LFB2]